MEKLLSDVEDALEPKVSEVEENDGVYTNRYSTDSTASTDSSAPTSNSPLSDLEAQRLIEEKEPPPPLPQAVEYTVPTKVKLAYLAVYFILNLSLTLYNKAILGGFKFPWLMTAIHCTTGSLGCSALHFGGVFSLTKLKLRDNLVLVAFSFLYTLNIAISNVSLSLVSVPTHQILRSTSPAFMVLAYRLIYARTYSKPTYLSLIPIISGVGLATYGDYYYTLFGFLMTMLGVLLAVAKSIISNHIMTGSLKLSAYEILLRMSPLAAIQSLCYCWATGEAHKAIEFFQEGHLTTPLILAIVGNGLVAFALNIASFQTNKMAGALTLTVAANLKQCLTILFGIFLFDVKVGLINGVGMLITVTGAAFYSKVELDSKKS